MSYDVRLNGPDGRPVAVSRHTEGGTRVLGGTTEAWLNITYNYSRFYYEHLDGEQGIRWLYGKRAGDTIERLRDAVNALGALQDADYWTATPGNAGYALAILLEWAEEHPDAVWGGD